MATAYTKGDALGIFPTMTDAGVLWLGGNRAGDALHSLVPIVDTPIPPLTYAAVSGMMGAGECIVSVKTANALSVIAPGDTAEGTEVAIGHNESVLIEANGDPDKWLRVYRDSDYSGEDFEAGGVDRLSLVYGYGGIGMVDVDTTGAVQDHYASFLLHNQEEASLDITAIKAWVSTLAVSRTTAAAWLGGAGAGIIQTATADGFATWRESGWARVESNAGALKEIVYYSSRTSTVLTVPAAGRGRLGTAATAGAFDDVITEVPGIRIGIETTTASTGSIQQIANATTAPAAITWNSSITSAAGLSHATLQARQNVGIWVHREIPNTAIYNASHLNAINLEFVCGGVTYTNQVAGKFRIGDTALANYREWHVSGGGEPDTTAAANNAWTAFPSPGIALTPPGAGTLEYRVIVKARNKYGLETKNIYSRKFIVDSGGVDVHSKLSPPRDITIVELGSSALQIVAFYDWAADVDPADTWLIYATFGGGTPDPDVDTPVVDTAMDDPALGIDRVTQLLEITNNLFFGSEIQIIVRVKRSSDSAESENLDVYTHTIESTDPHILGTLRTTESSHFNMEDEILVTQVHDASPLVQSFATRGCSWMDIVGVIPWRCIVPDSGNGVIHIPQTLSLVNGAVGGAGTNGVEVIDANTVYLVAGLVRQVKIDLAAGTITAPTFVYNGVIPDYPAAGPLALLNVFVTGSAAFVETCFNVYNPVRNRWEPFIYVDVNGVCTFGFPIIKTET